MIYIENKPSEIKQVNILVKLSCFAPEFTMNIQIPDDEDVNNFIDNFLNSILNEEFKYNVDWELI